MQGELILAMTYGYEPQGRNDRKINIARQLSDFGSEVALPGALLVNDLPFCMLFHMHDRILLMVTIIVRHIPEWLPWLSYKPLARSGYNIGQETMHEPIRFVKESMVSDCFMSARVRKAHYVPLIAQWHSTTFTRSRESTGGGELRRIRTQKDRGNNFRSFRVDVRRLAPLVDPLKFD
jgi:hypothetical protein